MQTSPQRSLAPVAFNANAHVPHDTGHFRVSQEDLAIGHEIREGFDFFGREGVPLCVGELQMDRPHVSGAIQIGWVQNVGGFERPLPGMNRLRVLPNRESCRPQDKLSDDFTISSFRLDPQYARDRDDHQQDAGGGPVPPTNPKKLPQKGSGELFLWAFSSICFNGRQNCVRKIVRMYLLGP